MKSSTKQGKPRVVLDTNIVVSALIAKEGAPARVFEKLLLGKIANYTSKEIIKELIEVLGRKEIAGRTTKKARAFVLRHYLNSSIAIVPRSRVSAVEHESDNKFIETSLDAKASHLITGDKHLLKLGKFREIRIVTAKEFLKESGSESR